MSRRRLRLGLDLLLEPTTLTGTGIYARSLIRALASLDQENDYVLFLHLDNLPAFRVPAANFRYQAYKFAAGSPLTRRLAQQALLAGGGCLGLDLLHSLTDAAPLLYRGRQVLTVHDLGPFATPWRHGLDGRLRRPLMIRSVARADRVIAVSGHTQRDLLHYLRTPPGKVTIIPHGVDLETFRPEPQPSDREEVHRLGLGGEYVLFVGRLERGKNLLALLGAYQLWPEEIRRRFALALVGPEDNMAAELRERAVGMAGRVVFTGYVEHRRLPALYRQARLTVMPSVYEGFGLPLLEAMACGSPVVATRVSSMPEVVGEAGLLVTPGDVQGLSGAMQRLCRDDGLREELSARGLKRAARFSWREAARRTLEVYWGAVT